MLELEGAENSITHDDFLEVEKLAGGVLPLSFKTLYLSNNGGFPAAIEVEGEEYVFSINGFNPIKFGSLPIEKLMQAFYGKNRKLRGYVPLLTMMAVIVSCFL